MDRWDDDKIPVTESSGNVFADLGVAEPEEDLAKAQLASHVRAAIRRRKLSQSRAAALLGVDQPKVSAIVNGRLEGFSSDRLFRLLTALGVDIELTIRHPSKIDGPGRLRVVESVIPETFPGE